MLKLHPQLGIPGNPQLSAQEINIYLKEALAMSEEERIGLIRQLSAHAHTTVLVRLLLHSYYPNFAESFISGQL